MNKNQAAWDSRPTVRLRERPDISDPWASGYFPQARDNWDTATWVRDYDELRHRDLAVFCLGDVRGKKVLDVACGDGLYMIVMARLGAQVSGQDISDPAIGHARSNLARHGVSGTLELGDATVLRFENDSFDAVFSADFVEHISGAQKVAFIAEVFRVLRPGGTFVIKTPNLSYLRLSTLLKRCAALLRGRSPFRIHILHTRGNPDHEHHGLSTFGALRRLLLANLFHSPSFQRAPLSKRPLPILLQERLPDLALVFNRDLILTARKPVFLGYFP